MEKKKLRHRVGELKVMWYDRYFIYLSKPMNVLNFIMITFVSLVVGLPWWVIPIMIVGIAGFTILIGKKDRKVLQQEQEFMSRNNPIIMGIRRDLKYLTKATKHPELPMLKLRINELIEKIQKDIDHRDAREPNAQWVVNELRKIMKEPWEYPYDLEELARK